MALKTHYDWANLKEEKTVFVPFYQTSYDVDLKNISLQKLFNFKGTFAFYKYEGYVAKQNY